MTPEDLPDGKFDQLGAIHRFVRDRRHALGLNLRDAAEQIGISFNSLSRVERGYPPDSPSLIAILSWLGLPVAWLDGDGELNTAAVGEAWAYWRGWQDCAKAHRDAVDQVAPMEPPARITPEFAAAFPHLADSSDPACSECGGRPKHGLIQSEDGQSWQCEGCYHDLASGPEPSSDGRR